jgi:glycerophosphoryl diester phosphodiesterase
MNVEEVEFDVHPTSDGAIVVHHDATLDATTDTSGTIAQMPLAEIRGATIRYSAGGHPLTLDELCSIYVDSNVDFRCEIKPGVNGLPYEHFVDRVVALLRQRNMLERTTFSSFLIPSMDTLLQASDRPSLWLVSPPVLRQLGQDAVVKLAVAHGIKEIGVHIDTADATLQSCVAAAGLDFGCWAAHSVWQIEKAFELGVKVFTTDRPTLAMAIRERRGASA